MYMYLCKELFFLRRIEKSENCHEQSALLNISFNNFLLEIMENWIIDVSLRQLFIFKIPFWRTSSFVAKCLNINWFCNASAFAMTVWYFVKNDLFLSLYDEFKIILPITLSFFWAFQIWYFSSNFALASRNENCTLLNYKSFQILHRTRA